MRRQSKGDAQLLQMTALRYGLTEAKGGKGPKGGVAVSDRVKGSWLWLWAIITLAAVRRRQAAKIAKANMADVAWNLFLL